MKPNQVNSLHLEYRDRFEGELEQLVQRSAFAEIVFKNHEILFSDEQASFVHSLRCLFGSAFDGLALGLSRIWDVKQNDPDLISIPNLVSTFFAYDYLGCRTLAEGQPDRELFEILCSDPLLGRLRTARTELFAHSLQIGTSKDRKRSDIAGSQEFNLVNGDVLAFCHKTMDLLYALLCQLNLSDWHKGKTLAEMRADSRSSHCSLLRCVVPDVVET